ncbi:hypothetical protein [Alkalicoccobacillus plakortidis]|uniref:Phage protein n=1 Tax=Alkalicoccobacillus plakortidis TaxID=444060 RepID=A0ABT0XFY7_9BACI|nr:hypothetical protein [Alkalicoccobacillus plakortidis]MCM2674112.1 hypothetical protein [Alkalicoccobacillus plakortidis]
MELKEWAIILGSIAGTTKIVYDIAENERKKREEKKRKNKKRPRKRR